MSGGVIPHPCPCCWVPDPDLTPSPEALDLRHAGHARILNPDEDRSTPDGAYAADEPVEEE